MKKILQKIHENIVRKFIRIPFPASLQKSGNFKINTGQNEIDFVVVSCEIRNLQFYKLSLYYIKKNNLRLNCKNYLFSPKGRKKQNTFSGKCVKTDFLQLILYILFLFALLLPSSLIAQYSSFDLIPSHPIGGGMASNGVGLKDSILNLSSNPAFLAGKKEAIIDGGLNIPFQGKESSSIKPTNLGAYYPLNSLSGVGFSGKTVLHSAFPDSSKFSLFQGHFFYSIVFSDRYYFSFGLGPGIGFRQREQSNLSLSPYFSGGVDWGKLTIGFSIQSPGGVYRYKLYRGGDELNERLPPIGLLGLSYNLSKNLQLYSEFKRLFFEKSSFQLNGEESKPNFDRGFGAEVKASFGLSLTLQEESVVKIRSGMEIGGKYDSRGKNLRGTGLGFGIGYLPNPNGKGFEINLSVLDYSLLSPKDGYPSETFFFSSLGYHFGD